MHWMIKPFGKSTFASLNFIFFLINTCYIFISWNLFFPWVMSLKNWLRSKNMISTRPTILWCSIVLLEEREIKSLLFLNNQSMYIHVLNTVALSYWVNIVESFKSVHKYWDVLFLCYMRFRSNLHFVSEKKIVYKFLDNSCSFRFSLLSLKKFKKSTISTWPTITRCAIALW